MNADELNAQQSKELAALIATKDEESVFDAANAYACEEDPDCQLAPILDGVYAALPKDKDVWVVPTREERRDGTDSYYIFIDTSFENVKRRIETLPGV